MNDQARIALTTNGNVFEISGPETFVSAQVELFREAIIRSLSNSRPPLEDEGEPVSETPAPAPHHNPTGKVVFERVLHVEGDKVRLLKSVPGTTISKKAVGTAVIYLWAKREAGVDDVPFSELREVCKAQGCLDPTNFSSQMKSARSWIIVDGTKGSSAQTCKLTVPGVEHALEVLKALNGA